MEFLEVPLYDDDILKLLVRFGINLLFLGLLVWFAIMPNQRQRDFAFTAVMLNVVVFFICFTMKKLELDLGLALGLFAVFGVLRYRTDAICPKEMTYLFIVIGLGVINSLANKKTSYAEVALVNSVILGAAMLKEAFIGRNGAAASAESEANGGKKTAGGKKPSKYTVETDRVELLGEEYREALIADLRTRTGMSISRVEVKSIDLTQNRATLSVWTIPPAEDSADV